MCLCGWSGLDCCTESVCVCVSICRAAMSELQAVLEFQVELFKFFNIDLFQRG